MHKVLKGSPLPLCTSLYSLSFMFILIPKGKKSTYKLWGGPGGNPEELQNECAQEKMCLKISLKVGSFYKSIAGGPRPLWLLKNARKSDKDSACTTSSHNKGHALKSQECGKLKKFQNVLPLDTVHLALCTVHNARKSLVFADDGTRTVAAPADQNSNSKAAAAAARAETTPPRISSPSSSWKRRRSCTHKVPGGAGGMSSALVLSRCVF